MSDILKSGQAAKNTEVRDFQSSVKCTADLPEVEGFLPFEILWQGHPEDAANALDPMQVLRQKQEEVERLAEEMISQAKKEVARIQKEAYEEGLTKGIEQGREEGRLEYEKRIGQMEKLFQEIQCQRADLNRQYEQDLLPVIKAMVDRLVNHEVSVNINVIKACLRKTLDYVVGNTLVKVHLHPDDFNRIKEASMENPDLLEGKNKIQLIEDPGISAGGCLIDTEYGEIDATLDHRRENLNKAVDEAFYAALSSDFP